jgi:pimeloyl-ACP methyl ester carboxylesterase
VIWSEKDRLVSSHCSQNIAKKFDASCFTHPTAGHDLPLDEPEWLTQILSK